MPIDMSLAAKAPPRKRTNTPATRSAPQQDIRTDTEKRAEGLIGLGQLFQGFCLMTGQFADAAAIGKYFGPVAHETAVIADTYPVVAKPVDMLIKVGPFGALIAAGMPLVMQLAANHKLVNPAMLAGQGVVPPETLEAEMKGQIMRQQATAMRQQQAAIREAQEAQRDLEEAMGSVA